MYLGHTCGELRGQVPTAEVDIEQGGLNAAMAGEGRNLVDVPAGARKVGQTEMAQRVRAESLDLGTSREFGGLTFDQLQIEIGWV